MLSTERADEGAGSGVGFAGMIFRLVRGARKVAVEILIVLQFRVGLRESGDQTGTVGGGAGLDVDVPVGAGE